MIPAPFEYAVAKSIDHAIDLLGRLNNPKLLAGGHSLLPRMKARLVEPATLIDIGRVNELVFVRELKDELAIGSLSRYCDLQRSAIVREHCPLLSHAAGLVGDLQVRHRGTIGGAVSYGDPAGDLPTVLLALRARFHVAGPGGQRVVPADEFFLGNLVTALGPQDLVTEIHVEKLEHHGWAYQRLTRRAEDWPTVAVAATVSCGSRHGASIALANMGATPLRATESEARYAEGDLVAAAERAAAGTSPTSDFRASADYRSHLARVLVRRALEEAERRAS